MATIGETAYYVRSKNAGPFWVTVDIFCGDKEVFEKISASKSVSKEKVAEVYGVRSEEVKIFYIPNLNVIKISYPRLVPQGQKYERDMHAGQQYVQISELEM
ncbi:MAG: DUF4387 domain-containing protein [Eubacteriales bacterium]|nr:DUF4387 domain-containing protein [Eubacteriales bacterium]